MNYNRNISNDSGSSVGEQAVGPQVAINGSVPLDGSVTNRSEEEDAVVEYICDVCRLPFANAQLLGMHQKRTHPIEFNEKIDVTRVKGRWSMEEIRMMAEMEAKARGVRFINVHLHERLPHRTLLSIKGERRRQEYKDLVNELMNPTPVSLDNDTNESSISQGSEGLDIAIENIIDSLADNRLKCSKKLVKLARKLLGGDPLANNQMSSWLKNVFNNAIPPKGPFYNKVPIAAGLTSKQKRRQEFAEIQTMYRQNFSGAVRKVLEDDGDVTMPPVDDAIAFWRGIFSEPHIEEFEGRTEYQPNASLLGVWAPITTEDVMSCELGANSAAGLDGIRVVDWIGIDIRLRTLFLNMILKRGCLDDDLKIARTVLIPKGKGIISPESTRPLSITSVVVRHLHKILAKRLKLLHTFSESQKAFIDCDGTQENLTILNTLLTDAKMRLKSINIATLDLRKAFDSVSHKTIIDSITAIGCPKKFIDYVTDLYLNARTVLQYDGSSTFINIARGVLQGDPLSPLLFNLVMDRAIAKLSLNIGYTYNGVIVNCIAYADDIILIAETKPGLQSLIDVLTTELASFGLQTNIGKSSTISMIPSGRQKKIKVITEASFLVAGQLLRAIGVMDVWRYLGIDFRCNVMNGSEFGIDAILQKVDRAPLKPQQRLKFLRVAVIPRYLHSLVLGRVNRTKLASFDNLIRKYVRKWLYLPHDVPLAYFYADVKSGGLGIPCVEQQVPLTRKNRLTKFISQENRISNAFKQSDFVVRQLEWCDRILRGIGDNVTKEKKSRFWASRLTEMVDTNDLKEAKVCRASNSWVDKRSDLISGGDYIHYNHIRVGCLPSKARTTRGTNRDRLCRAGCRVSETNYHVIQTCVRTHGGRSRRHDRVVDLICENLGNKGFATVKEPKLKTSVGLRKPDLLVTIDGATTVVDVQIVNGRTMRGDYRDKVDKYKSIPGMDDIIKRKCSSRVVSYDAVTLSYKGLIMDKSYDLLRKKLKCSEHFIFILITSVLRGTWLNWNQFNKNTALAHSTR